MSRLLVILALLMVHICTINGHFGNDRNWHNHHDYNWQDSDEDNWHGHWHDDDQNGHWHEGHYGNDGNWHHHHDHDWHNRGTDPSHRNCHQDQTSNDEVQRKYAEAEKAFQKFCDNNTKIVPTIMYGSSDYIIKYSLPDKNGLAVSINIQNHIITTIVTGNGEFKGFKDVRMLPDILKVKETVWMYESLDLKIMIPYKYAPGTEYQAECGSDEGAIRVPSPRPDIGPRMRLSRRHK